MIYILIYKLSVKSKIINIYPDDPLNENIKNISNKNVIECIELFDFFCHWSERIIKRIKRLKPKSKLLYLPFGYDEFLHKKYKNFTLGGSTDGVDLSKTHGTKGFGIECAVVTDEIKNLKTGLAKKWRVARDNTPSNVRVKQTITGPHMLSRFSVNERVDLYPDDIALAKAYAKVITEEIESVVKEGCDYIQFDEPVWTENVKETLWAAEVLNEIIEKFPNVNFNLHVCGGNAHRKRGFFGKYTDMIEAFKKLNVHEIHLEHCSLHYKMLDVFNDWNFDGKISLGVIDQRIDNTETEDDIINAVKPALEYFPKEKILLTSECGFGHVPIDIVRNKIKMLVSVAKNL